jgi:hypothetical protein
LAGLLASVPLFYADASLYPAENPPLFPGSTLRQIFFYLLVVWIAVIIGGTFFLTFTQLRSTTTQMTNLGQTVEREAHSVNDNLSGATDRLKVLERQNRRTVARIESVSADIAPIKILVDATKTDVGDLRTDIENLSSEYASTAQNATDAMDQATRTLKLVQMTTLTRTVGNLVDRGLLQPIGGGARPRSLSASQYFVYLNPNDSLGLCPFYLESDALSAVLRHRRLQPAEAGPLRVLDVANTGSSYAWKLTQAEKQALPPSLDNIGEVVSMAVESVWDRQNVGVLVITRSTLDPIFFDPLGNPSVWFGEATDQVANMRDDIAPVLTEAAQLVGGNPLEAQS